MFFLNISCETYNFKKGLLSSYPGVFLIEKGINILDIKGLNKNFRRLMKISNSYFQKPLACKNCLENKNCAGIFQKYIKAIGKKRVEEELRNVQNCRQ